MEQFLYKQKKKTPLPFLATRDSKTMNFHKFQKEHLDAVFVPHGVLMMLIYHSFSSISTSCSFSPPPSDTKTRTKKNWVGKLLQDQDVTKNVLTAIAVISSSITATVILANSTHNFVPREIIYGNTQRSTISIKYICLLTCFLLAFSCFVQSTRHFVHSNYLLSTVGATMRIDEKKAERAVQRGSEFWSLGLRALYFALNFLLWFFGAIPMFASSIVTVLILSCHEFKKPDTNQLAFAF